MKKFLVTAAVLAMGATAALAAPNAPNFNTPVKVGEGKTRTNSNRVAIDGANIYAGYGTPPDAGAKNTVRVVSSSNSGETWGLSRIMSGLEADGMYADDLSMRVAVSNDPLYSGKKIIHAAWTGSNADFSEKYIFYAYKADRPTLSGWSTPVQIPFDTFNYAISLMVSSNGEVHIIADSPNYSNSHITAASPESPFTVTPLPFFVGYPTQAVRDSAGNIYVAGVDAGTILLAKKIGSADWSTPVTVATGALNSEIGLAVADTSNFYVSFWDGTNTNLAVTSNGGTNWTTRTVGASQNNPAHYPGPVVAVTTNKVITYATETYDADGFNPVIKVYRSNDQGATWSSPTTIQGQGIPTIALDSSNKAHILVRDEVGDYGFNPNLLHIKEK